MPMSASKHNFHHRHTHIIPPPTPQTTLVVAEVHPQAGGLLLAVQSLSRVGIKSSNGLEKPCYSTLSPNSGLEYVQPLEMVNSVCAFEALPSKAQ